MLLNREEWALGKEEKSLVNENKERKENAERANWQNPQVRDKLTQDEIKIIERSKKNILNSML